MNAHQNFTSSNTAYLRNLDADDRQAPCVAVHFQRAPTDLGDGRTSMGFITPVLLVTAYVAKPDEFAQKVALILENHWADYPDTPDQAAPDAAPATGAA